MNGESSVGKQFWFDRWIESAHCFCYCWMGKVKLTLWLSLISFAGVFIWRGFAEKRKADTEEVSLVLEQMGELKGYGIILDVLLCVCLLSLCVYLLFRFVERSDRIKNTSPCTRQLRFSSIVGAIYGVVALLRVSCLHGGGSVFSILGKAITLKLKDSDFEWLRQIDYLVPKTYIDAFWLNGVGYWVLMFVGAYIVQSFFFRHGWLYLKGVVLKIAYPVGSVLLSALLLALTFAAGFVITGYAIVVVCYVVSLVIGLLFVFVVCKVFVGAMLSSAAESSSSSLPEYDPDHATLGDGTKVRRTGACQWTDENDSKRVFEETWSGGQVRQISGE